MEFVQIKFRGKNYSGRVFDAFKEFSSRDVWRFNIQEQEMNGLLRQKAIQFNRVFAHSNQLQRLRLKYASLPRDVLTNSLSPVLLDLFSQE